MKDTRLLDHAFDRRPIIGIWPEPATRRQA
jgi:hypothetical protein